MANLQEVYQQYLDMPNSQRVNIARNCLGTTISYLESRNISSENVSYFIVALFKLFVSGDRSTGNAEWNFFNEVTGMDISYDSYFKATDYGANSDFIRDMDNLIDSMPQDVKNQTLVFGLCVLACDGKLTVSEQELLNRLIA